MRQEARNHEAQVIPPPFGASQAQWDNAVLNAARRLVGDVNTAPGGASDPSGDEKGTPPGEPVPQEPKYPYSATPWGYNCWWVTDEILRRAMEDLRCNDPEFRRREQEYWKQWNRLEARRRVGGGL